MSGSNRSFYRLSNAYTRRLLDRLTSRRRNMGAFRAEANRHRTRSERFADFMTSKVGSVPFLLFHIVLFVVWLSVNLQVCAMLPKFDPFPFGLLTTILTLEQSLLTVFIIISQNRAADIAELRNELDLQVNVLAEEEISKALRMLRLIGEKMNIEEIRADPEILVMESPLDHVELEKQTLQELGAKVQRIITASEWTPPSSEQDLP